MNWGKGLALSLIGFAVMMACFGVLAMRNPESLVTEDYYAEELRYQQRIDAQGRAGALTAPVRIEVIAKGIVLRFPPELAGKEIAGTLRLLRPNDPRADRSLEIVADSAGTYRSAAIDLWPGRYDASLEWQADGSTYHTAEKLVVQ